MASPSLVVEVHFSGWVQHFDCLVRSWTAHDHSYASALAIVWQLKRLSGDVDAQTTSPNEKLL